MHYLVYFFSFINFACSSGFEVEKTEIKTQAKESEVRDLDKDSEMLALMAKVEAGKDHYATNCSSCHNPIEASTKRNKLASEIQYAIQNVSGMNYLSNNSSPSAIEEVSLALSDDVKRKLEEYLADQNPDLKSRENVVTFATPPIGTRTYVASLFEELFVARVSDRNGDDNYMMTKINDLILKQAGAFGGTCQSRYEGGAFCPGSALANSNATMLPISNTLRKGYVLRACEEVLSKDRAVHNFLSKAQVSMESINDLGSISKVFNLYYPGRIPSSEVFSQLLQIQTKITQLGQSSLDTWRFTLLSLCKSSALELL